jgi:uncharacterized membrane protein HdeD (DUF308 family)
MGQVKVMRAPSRGWMLVAGAFQLAAGLVFLWAPALAAVAAGTVLGATLLVVGGVMAASGVAGRGMGWGWAVVRGAVAAITGVLLLADPIAGVVGLAMALGVYFAASGAARLALAVTWRPAAGWGAMAASGALGLVLAVAVLAGWPGTSLAVVGTLLGVEACMDGVAHLAALPAPRPETR